MILFVVAMWLEVLVALVLVVVVVIVIVIETDKLYTYSEIFFYHRFFKM